MFISIIIPTLNEEGHIGRLLHFLSTHPQKHDYEIIVVDGGSKDKTTSIVREFGLEPESTNMASRAHQMNVGAIQSKGKVLYFVHADTQPAESFVADIRSAIENGVESGCYRFKFDNPQNPLLHVNGFFTRFPFKWCRGGDQTLFIQKDTFDMLGGFDEKYVIMEDYDILDRIEREGISFSVLPKSVKVSARKYHQNSYLKVQITNFKAMKMYRQGADPVRIKNYYTNALN
ncbi:TIGR04283 family arsenosugar biosynthesis glycosyltransferase [Ekhidna sp.]|uniref:TIGR04283 family arsenosugar biosynthesis glycosyltransferase n=1 Tax=Ekhidna sp. TaxID=2608089 RepID=UPI003BADB4DB